MRPEPRKSDTGAVRLDKFRADIAASPATGATLDFDDRIAHLTEGRGKTEWLLGTAAGSAGTRNCR